jgi:hypothetical protein
MSWGQREAPLEQIEASSAKHLALEHFQARDLPLHWSTTPGQRDPSFDRVVIIAESFGKTLPGSHGTVGGTREPGLQLLGVPLAHELGKVLGEVDRLCHVRMLRAQLGELLGIALGALLLMSHYQPGRLTSGEEPLVGLGHDGEGGPMPLLAGRLALRLAHALGIASDGGIAPRIATPLELTKQTQSVMTASIPPFQEIGFIGIEDTAAAVTAWSALWQGGRAEIAKHCILADAELGRNGMPRPPSAVQCPHLLVERHPSGPALASLLLPG